MDGSGSMVAPAVAADATVQAMSMGGSGSMVAPIVHVTGADTASAIDAASLEVVPRRATADDYGRLLVPLGPSGVAFAVIVEFAGPERAAVWSVAIFLVTVFAMRNEEFDKPVARAADWLRPPGD